MPTDIIFKSKPRLCASWLWLTRQMSRLVKLGFKSRSPPLVERTATHTELPVRSVGMKIIGIVTLKEIILKSSSEKTVTRNQMWKYSIKMCKKAKFKMTKVKYLSTVRLKKNINKLYYTLFALNLLGANFSTGVRKNKTGKEWIWKGWTKFALLDW